MSGYYNQSDSYEPEEGQDNTGKGLRKQLEETLTELKSLREEVTKLKRGDATAADVLKDAGIDPALKDLIPEDMEPKDWVEKYSHLLGVKPKAQSEGESEEDAQVEYPIDEDPALAAEREAVEQMRGSQQSGSQSVVAKDALERMSKIDSEEELLRFFQTEG